MRETAMEEMDRHAKGFAKLKDANAQCSPRLYPG